MTAEMTLRTRDHRLKVSVTAFLVLAAWGAFQAVAHASTQSVRYTLGSSPVQVCQNSPNNPSDEGIAGACFTVGPADSFLDVTIKDDHRRIVAGRIVFTDENENENPNSVGFCGSVKNVAIPPGSQGFTVHTGPTRTAGLCGPRHQATSGTITVAIR